MPLSRAEIQHRYRERKKLTDCEGYLDNDRRRKRKDYIPVALLSDDARAIRKRKVRQRVRKHRASINAVMRAAGASPGVSETRGYESQPDNQLIVRLPNLRRNGPRKRTAKALARAHREIKTIKDHNIGLKRRLKNLQRKAQRHRPCPTTPSTPRSKTNAMLKCSGIRGSHAKTIKKHLLMGNVLMSQVGSNATKDRGRSFRSKVYASVAGKLLSKYRCMNLLCKETSLNRNRLSTVIKKGINFASKQKDRVLGKFRTRVVTFMEREDNCITLPGKKDCKKVGPSKIQKRILTDYLGNLHRKFTAENPKCVISFASFCRLRPKHVLPANFLKRNCCLCSKHQNVALKLKMLKSYGLNVSVNPDQHLKEGDSVDLQKIPETVRFSMWKRVLVDGRNKTKIVEEEMQRQDFIRVWADEISAFKEHVFRVKAQYKQLKELKENLPYNELVVQMDFSENYSCKSADEIQSAYWSQTQVTLHPMVVYYKDPESDELLHKSFVCVSDESSHRAPTILAIIEKLFKLDDAAIDFTQINYVHYWTDSPTSQYRNKYIFYAVHNHEQLFGCRATWNYFESGHGKGPCDGIGGTAKRQADAATKTGGAVIQDANDFFDWARSSQSAITYFFVNREECANKSSEMESWKCFTVPGTMKLHAFAVDDKDRPIIRETSCYCNVCITDNKCDSWSNVGPHAHSVTQDERNTDTPMKYSVGEFVAATYEGDWFVGKIADVDEGEIEISFMERSKNLFRWPKSPDVLWMSPIDILMVLKPPLPVGKSARNSRMFRILEEDAVVIAFDNIN